MNSIDDFTLFGVRVGGDGEVWALGSASGLGSWRVSDDGVRFDLNTGGVDESGGWVHERDSGGSKFCLRRDDLDRVVEDGGRGRHVMVLW